MVQVTADLVLAAESRERELQVAAIERWRTADVLRRAVDRGPGQCVVSESMELVAPNVVAAKQRAIQSFSVAAFDAGLPPAPRSLAAEVTPRA